MGDIERWWRVVPASGISVWLQSDPSDNLIAAWDGADVFGPFVPESTLQGAVEALREARREVERLRGIIESRGTVEQLRQLNSAGEKS